jgi:hypothetical protein
MSASGSIDGTVAELSAHPHLEALCAALKTRASSAVQKRDHSFGQPAQDQAAVSVDDLSADQAETTRGNVKSVLERGAQSDSERELLSALLAIAFARSAQSAEPKAIAAELVFFEAHTPYNPLDAIDAALGEGADPIWRAVAQVVEQPASVAPDFGCLEAVAAAGALRASGAAVAREELGRLSKSAAYAPLRRLLATPPAAATTSLAGELSPAPRGPVLTTVLALTLVLFVAQLARLIGRLVLSYRRPAELALTARGIELKHRTELMGRVLRDRVTVVPLDNVARVTREVRFARVGLYVGLVALVTGSYLGMGLLVDGLRVPGGSPPLLGLAVLFIVLGLLLDFGLSSLADSVRGRCRVVVVPRKGRPLCIGALDAGRADAMLESIAEATRT